MAYGVFEIEGKLHIIPCDRDGKILIPHEAEEECFCSPQPHEDDERIIVHD